MSKAKNYEKEVIAQAKTRRATTEYYHKDMLTSQRQSRL